MSTTTTTMQLSHLCFVLPADCEEIETPEDLHKPTKQEEVRKNHTRRECVNHIRAFIKESLCRLYDLKWIDLFHSCDIDGSEGIQFNEFIVLLCLIYLLKEPSATHTTSKIDSPQLEATFDTVIEVFSFLDKNGDGKLNKTEVVKALNEASPREKSPAHVSRNRFKEMDWDKNGKVTFRQFLFAFIDWVGIETDGETSQEQS